MFVSLPLLTRTMVLRPEYASESPRRLYPPESLVQPIWSSTQEPRGCCCSWFGACTVRATVPELSQGLTQNQGVRRSY